MEGVICRKKTRRLLLVEVAAFALNFSTNLVHFTQNTLTLH